MLHGVDEGGGAVESLAASVAAAALDDVVVFGSEVHGFDHGAEGEYVGAGVEGDGAVFGLGGNVLQAVGRLV